MKLTISLSIVALVAFMGINTATAADNHRNSHRPIFFKTVNVLDVRPLYRYVRVNRPSRNCRYETSEHTHQNKGSATSTIVGALIGGAIGHRSGKNKGHNSRTNRAVVGAGIGALIGNSMRKKGQAEAHTETRKVCRRRNNYHEERRIIGYRTYYEFRGREYHNDLKREPGRTMRIRFVGEPAGR